MNWHPLSNCLFNAPSHRPLDTVVQLDDRLRRGFNVPSLPGDESCLLRYVPMPCRAMMGPNVYIVPPGAYTWFHIDGGGPVDSGHQALTGLNEVYMLRRLGPTANAAAVELLREDVAYSLGDLAHNEGEKPPWPQAEAIRRARAAGMSPSHLLLYPGDYLHIGKGRLHAFRKLDSRAPTAQHFFSRVQDLAWRSVVRAVTGCDPLPPSAPAPAAPPAPATPSGSSGPIEQSAGGRGAGAGVAGLPVLRQPHWAALAPAADTLGVCVSIAWDWVYMGSTFQVRCCVCGTLCACVSIA
jgi:hypothetical protein